MPGLVLKRMAGEGIAEAAAEPLASQGVRQPAGPGPVSRFSPRAVRTNTCQLQYA